MSRRKNFRAETWQRRNGLRRSAGRGGKGVVENDHWEKKKKKKKEKERFGDRKQSG